MSRNNLKILSITLALIVALLVCISSLHHHKSNRLYDLEIAFHPVKDETSYADQEKCNSHTEDSISVSLELPFLCSSSQQIITHFAYTVGYNLDRHIPNWVAYELTAKETIGEETRTNKFMPDPLVQGNPVVTQDYSNSGYDRGHMAPAADMKWSEQAMRESFYMTNICGITHKIVVPQFFYKVFLRCKADDSWTSIGFVMPNEAGNRPLMTYIQTVDEVEQLTGIDFFYNLPDDIEDDVESNFNILDWVL